MTEGEEITPVNIWNDIERVWVMRLDFVFEGKKIVGIHHSDFDDAINEIDWLCKRLQDYKKELELIYGISDQPIHRSSIATRIYVMQCGYTGLYKIGRSINPEFREKTILSQKPDIQTVFISPLTNPKNEKNLHRLFQEKRVRGEWFSLSEEDLASVKNYPYGE